ncbi:teichoic acids export ATP-binding protein TagH [Pedobacter glucosidilyticus]|nr:polysaccharide ABC transporter ATP-binding protein [Pedobacter glucosidilyticus]KHJ36988.1 teichoic acids export ATP-binding protein TagH [Pedobacter glucosidilyticus]
MSTAIKVENLSKAYQLGEIGTGTLSRDLERYWAKLRGKEDPFLKIGEANDRTQKGTSDIVWSLKDLNFEIEQGDAVGIIGRNGAGKSTLLKILSRVTSPTTGSVKIKGRVASLLEVGTGFHPELTGRENIFLNGAILGMRKAEIKKHFDAIVDFAGVERYIDTPVKRYSSGMYVRLAFAVAAHLESEILVIDEVLAVGDAEFQKKCLGKMNDVSKREGRTVLFVSHNLAAVNSLTNNSLFLEKGKSILMGSTLEVIKEYQKKTDGLKGAYINTKPSNLTPSIVKVDVITSESFFVHENGKDLIIEIQVNMPKVIEGMALSVQIINEQQLPVIFSYIFDSDTPILRTTGLHTFKCVFPKCKLYEDFYYLRVHLAESRGRSKFEELDGLCNFEVKMMQKPIEWGWQKNVCIYTEKFYWI